MFAEGGMSAQGRVCQDGVSAGGVCPVGCTPPPVNRITDRFKNITFPQFSFATVNILTDSSKYTKGILKDSSLFPILTYLLEAAISDLFAFLLNFLRSRRKILGLFAEEFIPHCQYPPLAALELVSSCSSKVLKIYLQIYS